MLRFGRTSIPRRIPNKIRALWTWGNNDFGRCGVENNSAASTSQNMSPVELKFLPQNLVQQVVCGAAHTLLLSASGRLFSCGLGVQDGIVSASAGFCHSAAVTRKGEVYTWGSNKENQLGIFKQGDKDGSAYPLSITALHGSKAIQVECGAYHNIVLTAEKEVFTWGKGANGRLGHGSEDNEVLPRRVESLRKLNIVSVAAGYDHSAAVSADGRLWMWGHGEWYQLGTGNKKNKLEPTLIEIDTNVKQVSCGGFHSAAVGCNGTLFTWGIGMYGALGHGNDTPSVVTEPCVVDMPASVQQVACGWKHCVAVTRMGDVFAWGHGAEGQLGMGNDHDLWAPARVPLLIGKSVRSVSAGLNHSSAF